MKRELIREENKIWYLTDSKKIFGIPEWITGDVSRIMGDVSGITGNVSGVKGNLDKCEITEEGRKNGFDINLLIKEVTE